MVFNSLEFAIFLPIVFLLYWLVFSKSAKSQNAFLLIASYAFYAFTDWRFLGLIAFTTLCSYCFGLEIARHKGSSDDKKAKVLSAANIVINLLILGFFKYFNFFVESFATVIPGITADNVMINLALPLGISYYTFSALSYTIDIYQGKNKATTDIVQLALYISFFPQIVAGPIGRSTYLLPQYSEHRVFQYKNGVDGLRQILWGLFKKVIVADHCATYMQMVKLSSNDQPGSALLIAIIIGAFQVYADFSGYSDIATGVARLLGIKLKKNFDTPFFSHNIAEYWNRWHISLTSWLRDYVFMSMGKVWHKSVIIRNTFIVFFLCGLWHGASWTYIIWGLYNATIYTIWFLYGQRRGKKRKVVNQQSGISYTIRNLSQIIFTFILIAIGFFPFWADSIEQLWQYIQGLFQWSTLTGIAYLFNSSELQKIIMAILFMMSIEWLHRNEDYSFSLYFIRRPVVRTVLYYLLAATIICFNTGDQLPLYAHF